MQINLTPVLDITYYNQDVVSPSVSPYWEHPTIWQIYHDKCLKKAGFIDEMIPYATGSCFYEIDSISDRNLIKLINEAFSKTIHDDAINIDEDELCALFGGYVLNVDGVDKLFPQCCSDLNDIEGWRELIKGNKTFFFNGHPTPEILVENETITFICDDDYERFTPNTDKKITVCKKALQSAFDQTLQLLNQFECRLNSIENEIIYRPKNKSLADIFIYGK